MFNDTIEGEKEFGDKAKETSRDVCSDEIEPASIATERTLSCSGKDYKNRVALAIHSRKTHGKCSYLGSAVTALQFNECEIKYPVKTKLKRHMATRHNGNLFENVVAKNLEAQIKVKALTEVIASHKVKKVKIKIPMDKNGKGYNNCRRTFQDYALLKTHIENVHERETVGYAGLNEIDNLELSLKVFKCQICGKMFRPKRHVKLLEVKNMDINYNPACC